MNQNLRIAAVGTCLVVLAGLAGYWQFSDLLPPSGETHASRTERAADAPAAAALLQGEPAPPQEAPPTEAPAETAPSIELLRIEPDGSAVLAGRAAPGRTIRLFSGDEVLASETANESGDFVIALTEPLAVGEHELRLEGGGADGLAQPGTQTAVVNVPPRGREDELLVALSAPGAPTLFIERPAAPQIEPSPSAAQPAAEISPVAPPGTAPVESLAPEPAASSLAIAAVEIEGGRLYVAGRAPSGSRLRLYVDEDFVAEAAGTASEEFLAEARADISVGPHVVRADEVAPDGTVVSRVEVPFDRPPGSSMAALAPVIAAAPGVPDGEPAPARAVGTTAAAPARATPLAPGDGVPAAPNATLQAALEPVEGRVIIRRGDTLWRISRQTYGAGRRYTTIYLANGDQIRDPDLIYPGQIFRLPDDDAPREALVR